jgi:ribosomal protein L11 methyltransferase
VPKASEEALSAALWELGTAGTRDAGLQDGRVVVLAYFADEPELERRLRAATAGLGVDVAPDEIPDVDWVARVREGFRAFSAGSFRIVPAWEAASPAAAGPRTLVVEPGVAFGTGSHESTRLCLAALEDQAREGPLGDVADVGAGSGILSVAAARLGARSVVAVELDAEALPVARRHAELNCAPVRLLRGDGAGALRARAFDVVLANISAPLLAERAEELAGATRGQGTLILSGFLVEDLPSVSAAYAGLGEIDVRVEGTWSALVVRRP